MGFRPAVFAHNFCNKFTFGIKVALPTSPKFASASWDDPVPRQQRKEKGRRLGHF